MGADLKKKDVQDFNKRLRKSISYDFMADRRWTRRGSAKRKDPWADCHYYWNAKYRYFLTAEYGGQTKRPHYHIIAYNIPIEYFNWDPINKVWYSKKLEEIWKKGIVHVGLVERGSAHYMTKYHLDPDLTRWNEKENREKPFSLMSRRPGLGANWIDDDIKDYFASNKNMYATLKNGFRQPIGRYYKEKLKEIGSVEFNRAWNEEAIKFKNQKDSVDTDFSLHTLRIERERNAELSKKAVRMLMRNNKI